MISSRIFLSLALTLGLSSGLAACTADTTDSGNNGAQTVSSADEKALVEAYIRQNISDLSPEPAVMGGTFQVTDVAFRTGNRAIVKYEDGHIALRALATYEVDGDDVEISSFDVLEDDEADTQAE